MSRASWSSYQLGEWSCQNFRMQVGLSASLVAIQRVPEALLLSTSNLLMAQSDIYQNGLLRMFCKLAHS